MPGLPVHHRLPAFMQTRFSRKPSSERKTWVHVWGPAGAETTPALTSPSLAPVASRTSPRLPRATPALQGPIQPPTFFLAEVPGWTPWAPWSACSQSCLVPGGGPALRSRSRLCPGPGDTSCIGEATQEEPCSPPVCLGMAPSGGGALGWGEAWMKRRTLWEGWRQTWLLSRSFSLAPSHSPPGSPAEDAQGGPGLKAC